MANDPYFGIDNLRLRFVRLVNPRHEDFAELAKELHLLMVEDNRAGVLSGTDRNGNRAPALQYRGGSGRRTAYRARSSSAYGFAARGVRSGPNRSRAGMLRFKGFSNFTFTDTNFRTRILPNNNLSTWQYQQLTGPRLAPRGDASRVISNYGPMMPLYERSGQSVAVSCAYFDVVSPKGVQFLRAHFRGENGLPKYDIAGIRPAGMRKAGTISRAWLRNLAGLP